LNSSSGKTGRRDFVRRNKKSKREKMQANFNTKWVVLCIVAMLATSACQRETPKADQGAAMFVSQNGQFSVPEKSPLRSHISVEVVGNNQETRKLSLAATVDVNPAYSWNILAPLTGKVVALKVGIGDVVKAGQELARIASGDFAAARSDQEKAADAFVLSKRAYERAAGVKEAGAAAVKDLEAAHSAMIQAQAELNRAESRLKSFGVQSTDGSHELVLRAPQNGIVTGVNIAAGNNVNDLTATLITMSNIDQVFVTAYVDEADVGKVVKGSSAEISLTAYPGRVFQGKVSSVNAALEPDTRRQKVRIAMSNPDGALKPNMYATVAVQVPGVSAVSVPQSALLMNNDAISVLVEARPWVFVRKVVKIGEDEGSRVHVLSGLAAGDRVVVKGGVLLND
jgi:cobalt-zinc-cadmium efflux system membrane fusion protein